MNTVTMKHTQTNFLSVPTKSYKTLDVLFAAPRKTLTDEAVRDTSNSRQRVMLEPYASRGARTDLRGGPWGNLGALPVRDRRSN